MFGAEQVGMHLSPRPRMQLLAHTVTDLKRQGGVMETSQALESDRHESESLHCHLLAVWSWASHSTSLICSFSINWDKAPLLGVFVRIK